jgi:hypothetical protein
VHYDLLQAYSASDFLIYGIDYVHGEVSPKSSETYIDVQGARALLKNDS